MSDEQKERSAGNDKPILIKAGDRRVLLNGQPPLVDCRVVAEDLWSKCQLDSERITELEATIDMANKTYKLTLQDITLAERVAELEAEVERLRDAPQELNGTVAMDVLADRGQDKARVENTLAVNREK